MKIKISAALLVLICATTFFGCRKEDPNGNSPNDPCYNKICKNGGYCQDGTCICPAGWTGSDCGTQVTPSKITVTKITVTNFNQNGDPDDTYPDIYVILKSGSTQLYNSPTYYTDATSPGSYDFIPSVPIDLNAIASYSMQLWDFDAISDDLLHSISFTPYSSTGGFPAYLTVNAGSFSCKVYVSYTY